MLELGTITAIIGAINWMLTLGKTEVKEVKKEIEELLYDLSKSLTNLYDLTQIIDKLARQIPSLTDDEFKEKFEKLQEYLRRFYLGQEDIRRARTRCGDVERDVERIKFKMAFFLDAEPGLWKKAKQQLDTIINYDEILFEDYDRNIKKLNGELQKISDLIEAGKVSEAKETYRTFRESLKADFNKLNEGIVKMRKASNHIRRIVNK